MSLNQLLNLWLSHSAVGFIDHRPNISAVFIVALGYDDAGIKIISRDDARKEREMCLIELDVKLRNLPELHCVLKKAPNLALIPDVK